MSDDVRLAKEVARELRGERPLVVRNPFCKGGWPDCECDTCRANYRTSRRVWRPKL